MERARACGSVGVVSRDGAPGGFEEQTTLLRQKVDTTNLPAQAFVLVAIEGPAAGHRFVLDGSAPSRVLVGQSPACEVRLQDREVSRRHAALDLDGRFLKLTDLGSTNGTFVDGVRIGEAYLRAGEIIRLGSTALRVDTAPSSPGIPLSPTDRFGAFIGSSVEMRRLYPLCERLANSTVPVVIEGETGTGKELLAESLHSEGARSAGPFVVFDCTAVPPNLVESELFGHERGAFTGAVASRKGVFEQAHGGTLLIDEIGDLDPSLQPKLLRALERSEVRRVGGDHPTRVDVRVLAATRRDLDREVQLGRFRDDLFHRLAVTRIELPPLRKRRGDVALLAHHFCRLLGHDIAALPIDALVRWDDAAWPGNVRELRNAVARQLTLGDLLLEEPASPVPEGQARRGNGFIDQLLENPPPMAAAKQKLVHEFERRYVQRMLELHDGNVAQAAAASGLARRYFQLLRAKQTR
jgi:two-component system, NtrC family, response regulator HydG